MHSIFEIAVLLLPPAGFILLWTPSLLLPLLCVLMVAFVPSLLFIPLLALVTMSVVSSLTSLLNSTLDIKLDKDGNGVPPLIILCDGSNRTGSSTSSSTTLCSDDPLEEEDGYYTASEDHNIPKMAIVSKKKKNKSSERSTKARKFVTFDTARPLYYFDSYDREDRAGLHYNEDDYLCFDDEDISNDNNNSSNRSSTKDTSLTRDSKGIQVKSSTLMSYADSNNSNVGKDRDIVSCDNKTRTLQKNITDDNNDDADAKPHKRSSDTTSPDESYRPEAETQHDDENDDAKQKLRSSDTCVYEYGVPKTGTSPDAINQKRASDTSLHDYRSVNKNTRIPIFKVGNYYKNAVIRQRKSDTVKDDLLGQKSRTLPDKKSENDQDENDTKQERRKSDFSVKEQCHVYETQVVSSNMNNGSADDHCRTPEGKSKKRKVVSFDDKSPRYYSDRFTLRDRQFLCYNDKEYKQFQKDIQLHMYKMLRSPKCGRHPWNVRTDKLCLRGLEKQIADQGSIILCFPALKRLYVKRKSWRGSSHERILKRLKEMQGERTTENMPVKRKRSKRELIANKISIFSSRVKSTKNKKMKRSSEVVVAPDMDMREKIRLMSMKLSKDDRILAYKRGLQDHLDAVNKDFVTEIVGDSFSTLPLSDYC